MWLGEENGLVGISFAFHYGWFRPLLVVMGMGPGFAGVGVGPNGISVRMGWAFRSQIPREAIRGLYSDRDMRGGIGVHGWRGRWLVNGAVTGIVTIEVDPPVRAWVVGFPIRLRMLHISVEDPERLVAAVGGAPSDPERE